MCGICASVSLSQSVLKNPETGILRNNLQKRGPDHFKTISSEYKDGFHLIFKAAVLHLRGNLLVEQPIIDEKRNILLWNGEIFGGELMRDSFESDTSVLSKRLLNADDPCEILQVIGSIEGPYAFIFYQSEDLLWFGRDVFGRRSLLWNCEKHQLNICSVSSGEEMWKELPTSGLFCLDLKVSSSENHFIVHHYPWSRSASGGLLQKCIELPNIKIRQHSDMCIHIPVHHLLNKTLPYDDLHYLSVFQKSELSLQEQFQDVLNLEYFTNAVNEFETVLSEAVKKRVECELGLCKMCYSEKTHNLKNIVCDHASIGVLFSGGLDSIVIACLADRYLPENKSIDLINVAFCNSVGFAENNKGHSLSFSTPDRITGENGLLELKTISPFRKWNFVEVNVSKDELILERQNSICSLLNPSCTVLDDSIGCALWFAARGKGMLVDDIQEKYYTSQVKNSLVSHHQWEVTENGKHTPRHLCCHSVWVLLVGMGADEQLAGYSRHRGKFNSSGWSGLIEELALELDRISCRNLGRDDRIIADHGVEPRHPFLDENVVSFLNSLPVWLKANLSLPRGVGEKLLLRLLAFKMGLSKAAFLPKRAIQFGSRIAKMENAAEKGSDICERLNVLN